MAFKFNPTTGKLDTVNNKAEQITIADAGAYYTGTEVESALQEIGASLAATIWQRTGTTISPLNTGDTLSVDTIIEEVAGNGVTIDSVLLKDGGATLTDDLIIDTDLFFVDVSAQTINVNNSTSIDQILDEDSMVTDSAMALATQQSIKAYVDNSTGAYLPLAGGVMTGDITLAESVTSVKTGAYSGYFSSGATSVGAPPSDTDPNIISYWKMDDNGIFPEDADDANLEAWWKFETGSGTVLVDELGVHNGSISNATWTGSGAFNASTNSLTFDGSNDSVGSFASTTDFDYTAGGAFTVAAWVYIDSASTTDMTVATNLGNPLSGSAKGWGMFVRSDDKVQFGMQESGGIYKYMKSSALSANTWYYVVGTWDNGSLNLYINGVLDNATPINSGTVTSTTPAFGTMTIGNSSTSTWDFYGKIDDVAIYNDARTADEILRDYDTTRTTITVDSIGTNHGTLSGATWVGSGAFGYTGDDSLSFDGVNDFVACSSSSQLSGTNKFTIQGWAKQDTLDVQAGLFEQITSTTNRVMMATWSDGNIYAVVANGSNSYGTFDYSAYVTAGEWFMFAMVYDGTATGNANRLKAYINGVQITLSFTGTIPATLGTNTADFDIGIQTNGGATEWNGDLDNFMIYDDVRSTAEILSDYNNSQSSGGNAWIFDTSNIIGSAGTLMQWKNNGTTKAYITGAGGLTLEDDLIVDTDLLFVDVSAQTVNINNSTAVDQILDEDNMATNSAMALATQQSIKAYVDANAGIASLVEDLTPQLGGDLDLNGKGIDFPTTPNITDVIDDDTFATATATNLATAESIKAYVDNNTPATYWTRTGTDLTPTTSGDTVTIDDKLTVTKTWASGIDATVDSTMTVSGAMASGDAIAGYNKVSISAGGSTVTSANATFSSVTNTDSSTLTTGRGYASSVINSSTGNIGSANGYYSLIRNDSSGQITGSAVNYFASVQSIGSGDIAAGVNFFAGISNAGSGTMALAAGYYVTPFIAVGTITEASGVYISAQTAATTNWGIKDLGNDWIINADNKGILFGGATAGDAKIYYDGTDMVLDPQVTGSGDVSIVNGGLKVAGQLTLPYVAKTGAYTLTASDYTVDCTSGTFTITLPTAVGITGRIYQINNSGTGVITVDGNGSETINGSTTQTLNQWEAITVQSNGVNWIVN